MPADVLEQLLRMADATAPAPPASPADLSTRVRHRHQRRRRNRAVAAAAAVFLLPLLAVVLLLRPSPPPQVAVTGPKPPPPPTRSDPARRALARLDLDASLHELTAAKLDSIARASPMPSAAPPPPPSRGEPVLAQVREQRDRAALILIYQADQAVRRRDTAHAVAAYRRTIELFPTTYWADVARRRLKEMPT